LIYTLELLCVIFILDEDRGKEHCIKGQYAE
jgi:hypothetical protein